MIDKRISVIFVFLLFLIVLVYPITMSQGEVESWGEQTITNWSTTRHHAFPGISRMPNGNLIVTWCNGTSHGSACKDSARISTDNGTTWESCFNVYSGSCQNTDPQTVTTANGTIICCHGHQAGGCCPVGSTAYYDVSYDNGTTWHSKGRMNPTNESILLVTSLKLINGVVYATCSDPYNGYGATIMKTTNNGSSWEWHGQINPATGANDEWDFLPLNNTHWIAIIRNHPPDSPPTETYWADSYDAGKTWTNITNVYDKFNSAIQDPNLNWLNKEERIIILHGRNYTGGCGASITNTAYWISSDEGQTWTNYTVISTTPPNCGGSGGDCGYTAFVSLSDSEGLIVYYNGSITGKSLIKSIHVAYNTTNNNILQFLSIAGQSNGTTICNPTPTINWTVVTNTSQYHLEIDNNADFSSPEINYTGINQWNYPSNCDINATRVSFTLPTGLSTYNKYYMRVRAYEKE